MARLVKCPRCSVAIDVTQLSGGATVRCAECGAMVRVPTGSTGVFPKAAAPVPAPPPAPGPSAGGATSVRARTRGTEIRRSPTRIVRPRSSNTGVIVAAIVSAAAVLIVLIVVLAGQPAAAPAPSRGPSPAPAVVRPPDPPPEPVPAPPEPAAPATPAPAPVARGPEDPARVNWDELMKILRPGGGFDDPTRPEGQAFARVKAMGKGAYPYLLRYLDHEELPLAVAAARVLNELTGRQQPLPTPANRAQVKAEWEAWIKANP
jgi:hypothetical protein